MIGLLIYLLLAHFIADFPLQPSKWVDNKRLRGTRGYALYLHSAVVGALSALAIGDWHYMWLALIIAISHFLIDWAKVAWTGSGPRAFVADQVVHFGVMLVIASWFTSKFNWEPYGVFPAGGELLYPALIASCVFCIWPANYLIHETIKYCRVKDNVNRKGDPISADSVKRSGALIGATERILVLFFILMGSFEAAGLTVAAKSLLRFNDAEGPRTEYVLAGTLMSLLSALMCAMAIRLFVLRQPLVAL